ncbi:MAG: hypothetical protein NZM38_07640 [Cytophagales bacterium]|nr:hypothetical protein [Cytophagales bacterium]MDW8384628.1 hypothetical protein [Flammeovirgaceae bacterium]
MPANSLINKEHFQQVTLNNRDFAIEVLEKSLFQAEVYATALNKALAEGDFMEIKKIVQQLKSTALIFGMNEWAADIRKIEMAHRDKFEEHKSIILATQKMLTEFISEAKLLKASF